MGRYFHVNEALDPFHTSRSFMVHLSVLQVDPIGPTIVLYEVVDDSGHLSAVTRRHLILFAKNKQMGIHLPPGRQIRSDGSRIELDKQLVSI